MKSPRRLVLARFDVLAGRWLAMGESQHAEYRHTAHRFELVAAGFSVPGQSFVIVDASVRQRRVVDPVVVGRTADQVAAALPRRPFWPPCWWHEFAGFRLRGCRDPRELFWSVRDGFKAPSV